MSLDLECSDIKLFDVGTLFSSHLFCTRNNDTQNEHGVIMSFSFVFNNNTYWNARLLWSEEDEISPFMISKSTQAIKRMTWQKYELGGVIIKINIAQNMFGVLLQPRARQTKSFSWWVGNAYLIQFSHHWLG